MRCTRPVTAAIAADGKTLLWSPKQFTKSCQRIQLPCRKCIECRMAYSREWGVRALHESTQHNENSFVTLTYDDEHLKDPKLVYEDFQKFIRSLRDRLHQQPMTYLVSGEYGSKNKRPHWHAILFGYRPDDCEPHYRNHRGDVVSTSVSLARCWGRGHVDVGTVTLESASYCARYALKDLAHGEEKEEYSSIFKTSTRPAIGSRWLEKFAPDVFNYGRLYLRDGSLLEIPRYYKKWCEKHRPELWAHYVTQVRPQSITRAVSRAEKEFNEILNARIDYATKNPNKALRPFRDKNKVRDDLAKIRLEKLQQNLKET